MVRWQEACSNHSDVGFISSHVLASAYAVSARSPQPHTNSVSREYWGSDMDGMYRKTTEPALQTLDIPFRVVNKSADIKRVIKECNECAHAWLKSFAVLLTEEALW
jgi:hypothetical protein